MHPLICSDGSEWAQKSARFALQLFRGTSNEITVLVFKQRPRALDAEQQAMVQGAREKGDNLGAARAADEIDRELHVLVKEILGDDSAVHWKQADGNMAEHLLGVANDYDIICLGGVGKGGFSRNLMGVFVDELVLKGTGNLLVTKTSDALCHNVLLALPPEDADDKNMAHYLGQLFEGSGVNITINIMWSDLPHRFEGYMEASMGQRVKRMVDEDLFPDKRRRLGHITGILNDYGLTSKAAFKDYGSMSDLVDAAEPNSYDLIIVRPPAAGDGFLQQLEPNKQSLNLMRKSASNVMLLRDVPVDKKRDA